MKTSKLGIYRYFFIVKQTKIRIVIKYITPALFCWGLLNDSSHRQEQQQKATTKILFTDKISFLQIIANFLKFTLEVVGSDFAHVQINQRNPRIPT